MSAYRVVPFKRWHIDWMNLGGAAEGGFTLDRSALQYMEKQNSWTVLLEEVPIVSGGCIVQWPGRHLAWAYLRPDTGPHMHYITRKARMLLSMAHGRLEFTVRQDFKAGHKWARLLGFHVENPPGILERYGPHGENHVAYVRFNK